MVVNRIENNSSRHETKTPKMLLKLTINTSEDSLRGRPQFYGGPDLQACHAGYSEHGSHLLTTICTRGALKLFPCFS
jgi:hypothetical protein